MFKVSHTLEVPEVIVEVTNACDRNCSGCYAPNVFSNENSENPFVKFLSPTNLISGMEKVISQKKLKGRYAFMRGGEPSLNPRVGELCGLIRNFGLIPVLETHGGWILNSQRVHTILSELKLAQGVLKISYDKMHGTTQEELSQMVLRANSYNIPIWIAVTEKDERSFVEIAHKIDNLDVDSIIYQRLAETKDEIIRPRLGTITASGQVAKTVTTKFDRDQKMAPKISKGISPIVILLFSLLMLAFNSPVFAATVKVGLISQFIYEDTGKPTPYADDFRSAAQLAVLHKAQELKKKDIQIQFSEYNYNRDKKSIASASLKASKAGVHAVMGFNYSSAALVGGSVFQREKIPLLLPMATADRLDKIGRYVRRTCFKDSDQGRIMAVFAHKKKFNKIALITVKDCTYCQSLKREFSASFEGQPGSEIVADLGVLSGKVNVKNLVKKLKGKGFDAIVLPNHETDSAAIISGLYDAGVRPKAWLGGDGWGNSQEAFWKTVGSRKINGFGVGHWSRQLKSEKSQAFVKNFTRKYKKVPGDVAVLVYEATTVLLEALLRADEYTREGIISALEKTSRVEGVTGDISYTLKSRTPKKRAFVLAIKSKSPQLVDQFFL